MVLPGNQFPHPNWEVDFLSGNDIALLRLQNPVNESIAPVDLPGDDFDLVGVQGWTLLKYAPEEGVRQVLNLAILPTQSCGGLLPARSQNPNMTSDMFCAFIPGSRNVTGGWEMS